VIRLEHACGSTVHSGFIDAGIPWRLNASDD
jgi:hypothetical protein